MHEMSLVEFTLNAVEQRASELGMQRIRTITLVIGELRGVVPELMDKGFQLLTQSRPLFQDAGLQIIDRPTLLRCTSCGEEYPGGDLSDPVCPACGSASYSILQGKELFIESFEGDSGDDG